MDARLSNREGLADGSLPGPGDALIPNNVIEIAQAMVLPNHFVG